MTAFFINAVSASKTSKVRHKGTFSGVVEKLPYLKELGITAVLFMPLYEFDEIGKFPQLYDNGYGKYASGPIAGRINYWGYTQAQYFTPKTAYSASGNPVQELKELVRALHKNGIELILEFYFAERTSPNLIMDCIHYWVKEYHIDGVLGQCHEQ